MEPTPLTDRFAAALAAALGSGVVAISHVGGGDVAEARVPLHQLAPLAVHAIKFGGSYAASTERALDAVLARRP